MIAQPADATTMDPGRTTQVLTVNYFANLYDTLTRWDNSLKLQPALATAWKAVNETTWEVTLRAGVKFHDGSPLTAEDVKAVLRAQPGPRQDGRHRPASRPSSPCRSRARRRCGIVTKKPDPLIPVRMAQMGGYIYPARLATDEGVKELARKPIGTRRLPVRRVGRRTTGW